MARPSLWLLLAALGPTPLQALDLTPQHSYRDLEGVRIPILRFQDGPRRAIYQPPSGWRATGSGASLALIPGRTEQATVLFKIGSRPAEAAGETPDPSAFEAWARSFLPADASRIERVAEIANGFTLGTQASRELTFSYTRPAGRFLTAVAAVEIGDRERLAVVVSAREADFKAVHGDAIASLFSWQWGDE